MRIVTALLLSIALIMGTAVSSSAVIKIDSGVTNIASSKSSVVVESKNGVRYLLAPGKRREAVKFIAPSKGKTSYRHSLVGSWKRAGPGFHIKAYLTEVKVS